MIKKIIILGLFLVAAVYLYKKILAPDIEPFFKKNKGNVDLFGTNVRSY